MTTPYRRILAATIAASAALTLAACSGNEPATNTSAHNSSEQGALPTTIHHAFGETTIETAPERVAAVGWGNNEVPLALGITPVGMTKASFGDDDGDGILPWAEDKIAELGGETPVLFDETDGLPFEAIAGTKPDVILASYSGITEDDYKTLSKIAPVIAYPEKPWSTPLNTSIEMNSAALGKAEEGKKLTEDIHTDVDNALAKHPELKDANVLFTSFGATANNSTLGFYVTEDPRAGFLKDAGIGVPKVVEEASKDADTFWVERSTERPEDFADVDLIVSYGSNDPAENQKTLEGMQADPLLSKIPAIRDGHVAFLGEGPVAASASPSTLGTPWGVDKYFSILSEALNK
ncbi:iron-siderophore ABC transporter substrate-binding protein [Corynebacterium tapiri]|uniref:Iron-siderophore ABC transporter substrate-binding protein n=1 Tax=Corynebacterium tapiri TaxID=1448266 RepID=A0A5C4U4H3_9CORY|nr:iron-siderophore ABC transporter substrate-binding protein [Corynebacterium tapiri]TNL98466.1 iron-siderophore ABC transporter substrate-binding protein [Corynebacterium tapiri]